MIRVIIDTTPLRGQRTGIGNYLFYTLKYLLSKNYEMDYYSFSTGIRKFDEDSKRILSKFEKNIILPIPTSILYKYWNTFSHPYLDWILPNAHIYHATNYYLPPIKMKSVLSIYDLSFMKNVWQSNKKIVSLFSKKIHNFAKATNHIITCSNYSKMEIANLLEIPLNKITVAYPGVDTNIFYHQNRESALKELNQKYSIPSPFILFVGTIEERKNVSGLIDIFDKISDVLPHKLVIVGKKSPTYKKIAEKINKFKKTENIIIIDYIKQHSDLRLFYNSAEAFIFPSLEEGFGIPVLEAMACGCPVISSNRGALPEVVGNYGITHDPEDTEGFAQKIIQVLTTPTETKKLIEYGLQQSQYFTWEATANTHYQVYKRIANND